MIRRALVVAALAGLAATAVPSYAGTSACTTFSDPKGDGSVEGVAAPDPALDITKVSFGSTTKALQLKVSLDKLAERPMYAPGNRVQVTFTVKGREVVVYYKYSATRTQEENAFYQQGIRVDGTFFSAVLEPSVVGNDVVMSVRYTELKSAVGADIKGLALTGLKAEALASYVATNETWDTATAPAAMGYTAGKVCT